jgi:histidine triad (HIT) family protein
MATVQVADCEFCKIAQGIDDSIRVIAAAENWIAFFPLRPATRGHTLIIPREHVANLWETGPVQNAELINAAVLIGRAIGIALSPDGMNLITSAGEAAEQTIYHFHLHVVPRWYKDDFGPIWNRDQEKINDLDTIAERICRSYNSL